MTRTARFFLCLPVALALLTACGPAQRRITAAVLNDVESYINDRPDSALAVLESLDTARIRTPKTKAHYQLLLCIAKDKNYLDDGSDLRAMERAASWFSLHGSPYNRMRAFYYFADQQFDAGMTVEASVNFSKALDLAESQAEWFFGGLTARNLSDIFAAGYDYSQSVLYARKSVQLFQRASKPHHTLYSKLLLANGLFNTQEFEQCRLLCNSLISEATVIGDAGVVADALSTSAKVFVNIDPPVPDSTLTRLDRLISIYPLKSSQLAVYAWALCLKGQTVRSKEMIHEAYLLSEDRRDSTHVMHWDAKIATQTKELTRANHLQQTMQDYIDNQFHVSILNSIEKARAQYFKEQNDRLEERVLRERVVGVYSLILLALLIMFCFSLVRNRALRAEQQVREQKARIEEKDKANTELSEKLALYGTTVGETLDFGFDVLNRLSDAYYHPNTDNGQTYHNIIKEYLLDVSSRHRLGDSIETNINIIHNNVLAKLKTEVPGLKEDDIKLFSYCLFGFSYKTINALSPNTSSINTSYSRVFRLRKVIEKSGSEYTAFFLSFLDKGVSKNKQLSGKPEHCG